MRKIGLGLIGTGIATWDLHWPALKKLKTKYNLVAATNRTRRKAEVFAKTARIPKVVNSVDDLLSLKEVEAVLISVPIHLNARMVIKALKAGKHVIAEKPIAATVGEARKLVKTAAKYKKKFMIAENWYFWDVAVQLREWIAKGRIGKPRLIEISQNIHLDTKNQYFKTKWRQKPKFIGGFLVDGGVHIANVVRESFGMPKKVKSSVRQLNRLLPPADTMLTIFDLPGGVQGLWKYSFSLHDTGVPVITVQGDKGNAKLMWGRAELERPRAKTVVVKERKSSYQSEFESFYDCVIKGKPLAFKPRQALADLEFMHRLLKGK